MIEPVNPEKSDKMPPSDMTDSLVDAQLAGDFEVLVPSSGFVHAVMDSVRGHASEPPLSRFPGAVRFREPSRFSAAWAHSVWSPCGRCTAAQEPRRHRKLEYCSRTSSDQLLDQVR